MRKGWVFAFLAVGLVSMGILFGCGSSTSTPATTTTTTLSSGAKAGDSAYDAVKAVSGVSGVASTTGSLTGVAPSSFSALSVKASSTTPPDAFFAPMPSSGWITIEGAGLVSGETLQIRMYTRSGQVINSTYLAGRKIATFEGYSWNNLMSPPSGPPTAFFSAIYLWLTHSPAWVPGDPMAAADFYSDATKFRSPSSFWDYIVWAHIASNPSTEAALNPAYVYYPDYNFGAAPPRAPLASYPRLGTPEATSDDHIGSQEAHVTGTHPDGSTIDMTQTVSTDADGRPVSATGSGTMTRSDGVVMTINSMTMNFSAGSPTGGTMDITVGAPDNLHIVMTMTATGAASGDIYTTNTSPETKIGTVVIYGTPVAGHNGYVQEIDPATGNPKGDPQYF